ncbi:MAG: matrixin family metalloprotease [Oligoflexia bacterium]|nr:matrixin family metalloprotease [Oligoflexia bacterium]
MIKILEIFIFVFVCIFVFIFEYFYSDNFQSYAFVMDRNSLGAIIFWKKKNINVYVDTTNNYNKNSDMIMNVVENAAKEWNGKSELQINVFKNTYGAVKNPGANNKQNDIYFGKSTALSSGVLGVTNVSYEGNTEEIVEADIILNQDSIFTAAINNLYPPKLADIVTHEMGHLLGLAHSQIKDSTMLYTAFVGQSTLDTDDIIGIFNIAPTDGISISNLRTGTIKGAVIGSKKLVGIFAAQVQVVSMKEGRVITGVFTEDTGKFVINGLPLNDIYYLYINPVNIFASVPDYYLSASKHFCSGSSYKGSFFTTCDADDIGHPQGIYISEDEKSVDVGSITIKCGLDSPIDYLSDKDYAIFQTTRSFLLDMIPKGTASGYGTAMVGSFSTKEIDENNEDVINVDLSSYAINSQNEYYLELRLVSQNFYSQLRTVVKIFKNGVSQGIYPDSSEGIALDGDGRPYLNLSNNTKFRLSNNNSSENKFEIRVKPVAFTYNNNSYITNSLYGIDIMDYFFPAYTSFLESGSFYLLIAYISKKESDGTYSIADRRIYKPYEDNKSCPDAQGAFEVKAFTSTQDSSGSSIARGRNKKSGGLFGCGTIFWMNNGDNNGGSDDENGRNNSLSTGNKIDLGGPIQSFYNVLSVLCGIFLIFSMFNFRNILIKFFRVKN